MRVVIKKKHSEFERNAWRNCKDIWKWQIVKGSSHSLTVVSIHYFSITIYAFWSWQFTLPCANENIQEKQNWKQTNAQTSTDSLDNKMLWWSLEMFSSFFFHQFNTFLRSFNYTGWQCNKPYVLRENSVRAWFVIRLKSRTLSVETFKINYTSETMAAKLCM